MILGFVITAFHIQAQKKSLENQQLKDDECIFRTHKCFCEIVFLQLNTFRNVYKSSEIKLTM